MWSTTFPLRFSVIALSVFLLLQGRPLWAPEVEISAANAQTIANQFIARAPGGVAFYTSSDLSAGVTAALGAVPGPP